MKWIVATNLRADSQGAFEFAHWLHTTAAKPDDHALVAMAVIRDAGDFASVTIGRGLQMRRVEDATRSFVAETPAANAIDDIDVDIAPEVSAALCERAAQRGATLVLGRAAPRENTRLVRLGSVARRCLRRLTRPTVIVPPDWTVDHARQGPILVAVDDTDASLAALRFAEALAAAVGRPMVAVTALQGLGGLGTTFLAPAEFADLQDRRRREQADQVAVFLADRGYPQLSLRAEAGATVQAVLDVAEDVDAAAIVCGSRRLTLAERLFSASVGTELASFSTLPVAIVPPDFETA